MKLKLHYIVFVLTLGLATTSCKTKQELAEESRFQQDIDARAAESKLLLDQSGLDADAAEKLAETLKSLDSQLMDFLATDPDADARRATLKKLMVERNNKLKSSMTDEQYSKYLENLRLRTELKNRTLGAPAKDSGR